LIELTLELTFHCWRQWCCHCWFFRLWHFCTLLITWKKKQCYSPDSKIQHQEQDSSHNTYLINLFNEFIYQIHEWTIIITPKYNKCKKWKSNKQASAPWVVLRKSWRFPKFYLNQDSFLFQTQENP
jgi:hypothetical protein